MTERACDLSADVSSTLHDVVQNRLGYFVLLCYRFFASRPWDIVPQAIGTSALLRGEMVFHEIRVQGCFSMLSMQ
jgi:hypothetical protein